MRDLTLKSILIFLLIFVYSKQNSAQNITPRIDQNYLTSSDGIVMSNDKSMVANFCDYGKIECINLETQKVVYTIDLKSHIYNVLFGSQNELVVVHDKIAETGSNIFISHIDIGGCEKTTQNEICMQTKIDTSVLTNFNIKVSLNQDFLSFNAEIMYDIAKRKVSPFANTEVWRQLLPQLNGDRYTFTNPQNQTSTSIEISKFKYPINEYAYSPNSKYIAIASGDISSFWSVGGPMNEVGNGAIMVYDVEHSSVIYETEMKQRQPKFNVIGVVWKDNNKFILSDIKAEVMEFGIIRPYYEYKISRPNSYPTPLHIDETFSQTIFSNDVTAIFNSKGNTDIEIVDSNSYAYLTINPNGSFALAPFTGKFEVTTKVGLNNSTIKNYESTTDVSKMYYNQNGELLAQLKTEKSNSFFPQDSIIVNNQNKIVNKTGEFVGIRDNGIKHYDPCLKANNGFFLKEQIGIIEFNDLANNTQFTIQSSKSTIEDFSISQNQNFVSFNTSKYITDPLSISMYEYDCQIFDLREEAFLQKIMGKDILFNRFDEKSMLAFTVFEDSTFVLWEGEPENIISDGTNLFMSSSNQSNPAPYKIKNINHVAFNSFKNELIINGIERINYQSKKHSLLSSPTNFKAISPNGDYFYTMDNTFSEGTDYGVGGAGNDFKIWKWEDTFKTLRSFSVKSDYGIDEARPMVFFHKSKEMAMVNTGEGIIQLYDLHNNKLLLTIKLLEGREWMAYTPDGIFDGSSKGRDRLYYTEGQEVILLDQLKSKYWVPGLIDKIINKPFMLADITPIKKFPLFPTATIDLDGISGNLTIHLKERNGGIGKVALYIGNKEINPDINPNRTKTITIKLDDYKKHLYENNVNLIEIVTYNSEGWLQSRPVAYYVYSNLDGARDATNNDAKYKKASASERTSTTKKPGLYALFIGTSIYDEESLKLDYADSDAIALKEGFEAISADMYDTNRRNLKILTSSSEDNEGFSSKKNIIKALELIASEAKPDDIIFLFFSGHGITIDDDFYYLTHTAKDILNQDSIKRAGMTISAKEINTSLRNIASNKQVLVLDACHSGGIANILEGSSKSVGSSQEKALEFLEDKMGVYILASSEANQKSFETERLQQGLLTFSLLLGLSGEAMVDSVINVLDLLNYSSKKSEEIGKMMNKIQRPVLGVARGGSSFPIGFPSDQIKIASLNRPKITSAVINKYPEGFDPLRLSEGINETLSIKGGINSSSKALFVTNMDKNTYQLTGTYLVEGDNIVVKAYVIKNNEVVAGPIEKIQPKDKIKKLEILLSNEFLKAVESIEN